VAVRHGGRQTGDHDGRRQNPKQACTHGCFSF
jgi:hypothetical protein